MNTYPVRGSALDWEFRKRKQFLRRNKGWLEIRSQGDVPAEPFTGHLWGCGKRSAPLLAQMRPALTGGFLALVLTSSAWGQGQINFQGGQVTDFLGNPLSGAGFSCQLWGGGSPDPNLMTGLVPITVFQTGGGAGSIVPVSCTLPVPPGSTVNLQVRAWDNKGGTITSYAAAVANGTTGYGSGNVLAAVTPSGGPPPPMTMPPGLFGFSIAYPPSISSIPSQRTSRDTPTTRIPFTVGDVDTPASSLVVSALSSNPTLVPNANISFGGSGTNLFLVATPAAGQSGHTIITVTVFDLEGLTASTTFFLSVSYVASPAAADGDTNNSLRHLIIVANADPGPDFIECPAGTYALTIGGANEDAAATGDLDITDDLVIAGVGASTTIIDGSALGDRVFQVIGSNVNVTLSGVTIQGGNLSGVASGGGIASNGRLTLEQCVVQNCFAYGSAGGGIYSSGVLAVDKTTVASNGAQTAGGIYADGSLTLMDSMILNNNGSNYVGGISVTNSSAIFVRTRISGNTGLSTGGIRVVPGSLTMDSCEVSSNSAAVGGGGLENFGTVNMTNCTFSANVVQGSGSLGGAAVLNESATINALNCTFALNRLVASDVGGGILDTNGSFTARNCIFAGNSTATLSVDFYQGLISAGNNLLQSTLNTTINGVTNGNLLNTDPLLGPLQNNGGPTLTHALLPGSPAIDAGNNAGVPATDQRGLPRIFGGTVDLGAFEAQPIFIVLNTNDSGFGSLRQAILDANSTVGVQNIIFDIPGPGPHTIQPLSPLPTITDPVIIDGYTQPGASVNTLANGDNAVLMIELDGSLAGLGTHGLNISAGNSTVRGLVINRFQSTSSTAFAQLFVTTGGNNILEGNFIGLNVAGTAQLTSGPNRGVGIWVSTSGNNIVGGATPDARNVVFGVDASISTLGDGNQILGNFVTITASGLVGLSGAGVEISGANNIIGGLLPGSRNIIGGGTSLSGGTGNQVLGNYIGIGADGSTALNNVLYGVYLNNAQPTIIGGTVPAARNVISAASIGILAVGTGGHTIQGNFIGTDASGTLARGNGRGINLSGSNTNLIGGALAGTGNIISGNNQMGILIAGSSNNVVAGNFIGTTSSGLAALGNSSQGIVLNAGAANNMVGGTTPGSGNVISGNSAEGVLISDVGTGANTIAGNFIGTDLSGTSALGNSGGGIFVQDSQNNTIGGSGSTAGNVLAYNGQSVEGAPPTIAIIGTNATGNRIQFNSIFSNFGLGIDLGADGPTLNDTGDADAGPNRLQNYPQFIGASLVGTALSFNYLVDSAVGNSTYPLSVQFFVADSAGQGGQTLLFTDVYPAAQARLPRGVSFTSPVPLVGTERFAATATDAAGNTSEFSPAFAFNHAPVLDASKTPVLTPELQNAGSPSGAVGTLVSSLVQIGGALANVTDADLGAVTGLALIGAATANGVWFYSIDGGSTWNPLGAAGIGSARLLAADALTRLYFEPNANFNGTISSAITFRAWDQTFGNNGATADTTINGGSTAFSVATDTADLAIVPSLCPSNTLWPNSCTLTLARVQDTFSGSVRQSLDSLDQTRWYRFPVTPGSQLIVTLTELPDNYELFLFKDIAQAYAQLTGSPITINTLLNLNAEFAPTGYSPTGYSPTGYSPATFAPAAFTGVSFTPTGYSPTGYSPTGYSPTGYSPTGYSPTGYSPADFAAELFAAINYSPTGYSPTGYSPTGYSAAQLISLMGASVFPGTAGQGIYLNTWDNSGYFYACVHGRNGVFQPAVPYNFSVTVISGPCATTPPAFRPSNTTVQAGNFQTLVLTDTGRLNPQGDPVRAAAITRMQAALSALVARPEVRGKIIDVGTDNSVIDANAFADSVPECTFAKNLVASAIRNIVLAYGAQNPIHYVVLAGSDRVIPFFRYPDTAGLADENEYYPPVFDDTASQASLRQGTVLSQEAYGSSCGLSIHASTFPVADKPVGRLVETPDEITAWINTYLSNPGGLLPTPTSSLVVGYDFLVAGARAVRTELDAGIGTNSPIVRDDLLAVDTNNPTVLLAPYDLRSWTALDLRNLLLQKRHDIVFLAGHFDTGRALAADWTTYLYGSVVAAWPVNLSNSIVFGAGCHVAYNAVDEDAVPQVTPEPDWAQAFTAQNVAAFIGGTGYQYGDTEFVEYHERLYRDFAHQLRAQTGPRSVGDALVAAKRQYLEETPIPIDIHQKVILETVLFGLPMASVNLPLGRGAIGGRPSVVPPLINYPPPSPGNLFGLQYADVNFTNAPLIPHTVSLAVYPPPPSTTNASYLSGLDGTVADPCQPVLPLIISNVTVSGTVLRGVGLRTAVYSDQQNVLPLTGAPAVEIRGISISFQCDFFYPIQPWAVNYFDAVCGGNGSTLLHLLPAQYMSSAPGSATGTRRSFNQMNLRLFYSSNTTFAQNGTNVTPSLAGPPSISGVSAQVSGNQISFQAHAVGFPDAGIQEVWVTYTALRGPWFGLWQSINLAQDATDSTLWTGALTLPAGVAAQDVRFMAQAVNGVGLVALDTRLGAYYVPGTTTIVPLSTALTLDLSGIPVVGGTNFSKYNTTVTFKAKLVQTSTSLPLAGQVIQFGLGLQRLQAVTDNRGVAVVQMPLLQLPGTYNLQATFLGTDQYGSAAATAPFIIQTQDTGLSLIQDSPAPNLQVHAVLSNVLGATLDGKPVAFVVTPTVGSQVSLFTKIVTTDSRGQAALGAVSLPTGTYQLHGYFGFTLPFANNQATFEDPYYNPASNSIPIRIPPPAQCTVQYIGDLEASVNSPLRLAASNSAPNTDLTLLTVLFTVQDSRSNTVSQMTAPVAADGISVASVSQLPAGVYQVLVRTFGIPCACSADPVLVGVFDPNAGFVVGAGQIISPRGAYPPNPKLSGKATFTFVAQYLNGAAVPTALTEFNFPAAKLHFISTSNDWLVLSGNEARLHGAGNLNGAPNYGFLVTGLDNSSSGTPDEFRIKIWNRATGVVAYDTMPGAADTALPITPINSGNILVRGH